MNAIAERFVGSIKRECLDRLVLLGTGHLGRAVDEYVRHDNAERPYQGVGNRPIAGQPAIGTGDVVTREASTDSFATTNARLDADRGGTG